MTDEEIQAKAKDFINTLIEIQIELTTAKHRIEDVKDKAERVKTKADAEAFDDWYENHLLDAGLEHIEISDC